MKYALRFQFYSTFQNYFWHKNTLILYNGIEWNVVIVGIYFTCLVADFSFYLHTFVTHLNKWNTRLDFIFTAAAGRPPALAALPGPLRAAVDQDNAVYRREPLQRTANGEPVPRHD